MTDSSKGSLVRKIAPGQSSSRRRRRKKGLSNIELVPFFFSLTLSLFLQQTRGGGVFFSLLIAPARSSMSLSGVAPLYYKEVARGAKGEEGGGGGAQATLDTSI